LPFLLLGRNWLCFARFGPAAPALATLQALAPFLRARGKLALFRTHSPREASGALVWFRTMTLGRSRRNPPKLWPLIYDPLFCFFVIIQVHQFLVK
jgi:hypothetical protein